MRALRILLVLFAVFSLIFVAADRIAVKFAEDKAAEKIQSLHGLAGNTDVLIKGFPFLTQVAQKELDHIDVRMTGVEAGAAGGSDKITISELSARFTGVTVGSDYASATAASTEGTALIGYDALTKAAGKQGVKISYGGGGKVKVTADGDTLGTGREGTVLSTVTTSGGDTVRVRADEVPPEAARLPGGEERVRRSVDVTQQVDGLPEGIELGAVTATVDGVSVELTGENVRLAG
ncbi:DUF2993 domain-containing protein [Streptomyces sp. A7024]|uniref:DUF2993 domain-containing protein n=1 Tax=Streptomyces coryli TaxID=1128680 RepID=A0A6G4U535_9ACTN|nr:DUF2993 domain-containing protein [Streptomyces coryli]NGN66826.1 DUF2993 domain-containing protein [Streptomyces coryli]